MTKKIYFETLKSVLGRSILHYSRFKAHSHDVFFFLTFDLLLFKEILNVNINLMGNQL